MSCPAASSNGSPARERCWYGPSWSSPTSRPGTSTQGLGAEMLAFLRSAVSEHDESIVMVTHDPPGGRVRRPSRVPRGRQGGRRARLTHRRHGAGARSCSWGAEMRRVTIRGLLARKLRLALTALAIVLGVMFVTGTLVLTDTLNRTFDNGGRHRLPARSPSRSAARRRSARHPAATAAPTATPIPASIATAVRQACPESPTSIGDVSGYAQFVTGSGNAIGSGAGKSRDSRSTPTGSCPIRLVKGARPRPPTTW